MDLESGKRIETYSGMIALSEEKWAASDPESLKINGFSWEELQKEGKSAEEVAEGMVAQFARFNIKRKEAVFICQNPSFDRTFLSQLIEVPRQEMLAWPYHWLDLASMYWALAIERMKGNNGPPPWKTGFSKDQIAAHYKIAPEEKPHRARNGVAHLLLCYEAMLGFTNTQ